MDKPSAQYVRALEEATQHHASSKTYSGKFLRPHAPFIREIVKRLKVESILDYGCGKGRQYEWVSHGDDASIPKGETLESYWGVPVHKYDPAYPPFAQFPGGRFDLVICTHVLGSIPIADLSWVLLRLTSRAVKAVYIAEKIGEVGKQVFSEPHLMPRGWKRPDWENAIAHVARGRRALEVWLSTRENKPEGVIWERGKIQG